MKDNILLVGAWFNAIIGSLTYVEPFLSSLAYTCSIAGSLVYIYKNLKNNKNEEVN